MAKDGTKRGGARKGAGRRAPTAVLEFRDWWRRWFESKSGRAYLVKRARASDQILAKLIDKVYPTPTELTGMNSGPILHEFRIIEVPASEGAKE